MGNKVKAFERGLDHDHTTKYRNIGQCRFRIGLHIQCLLSLTYNVRKDARSSYVAVCGTKCSMTTHKSSGSLMHVS